MIACPITDPRELELPDIGLVELQDPETGELVLVDTSSSRIRDAFNKKAQNEHDALKRLLNRSGVEVLSLATDRPYIDDVRKLFKQRQKRARRSA